MFLQRDPNVVLAQTALSTEKLIQAYRIHGHRLAALDPLGLEYDRQDVERRHMSPHHFFRGLPNVPEGEELLKLQVFVDPRIPLAPYPTIERLLSHLRACYCGTLGFEYQHLSSRGERLWMRQRIEAESADTNFTNIDGLRSTNWRREVSKSQQVRLLRQLLRAESTEVLLAERSPTARRFSLEGGEAIVCALQRILQRAAVLGVEEVVVNMPPRGRLNVLANVLGKSLGDIASGFSSDKTSSEEEEVEGGDLPIRKGHADAYLGHSTTLSVPPPFESNRPSLPVGVLLMPNPSHLEHVNPVALGGVRAKQWRRISADTQAEAALRAMVDNQAIIDSREVADHGVASDGKWNYREWKTHTEAREGAVAALNEATKTMQSREAAFQRQVLGVQIHGDASFAAQGVVAETLALGELSGFGVGGCVHVVINNQIGFTTSPDEFRGIRCQYPTDIAKMLEVPVIHVNGDDPEAVLRAADIAVAFRQRFRKDVVIDVVCYRRHGNDEHDDPTTTHPVMYRRIAQHRTVSELYARSLVERGVLSREELAHLRDEVEQQLRDKLDESGGAAAAAGVPKSSRPNDNSAVATTEPTGVGMQALHQIGHLLYADWSLPFSSDEAKAAEGGEQPPRRRVKGREIAVHPSVRAMLTERLEATRGIGEGVDWATAEALAFGVLLRKGVPVRLSGQDVVRGTFNQRNITLHDQEDDIGLRVKPLAHVGSIYGHEAPVVWLRQDTHQPLAATRSAHPHYAWNLDKSASDKYFFREDGSGYGGPLQDEEKDATPAVRYKGNMPGRLFQAVNSNMSEAAVLAFEFGYSSELLNHNGEQDVDRDHLVVWEAQYGDFANVAQSMVDSIVTKAEHMWGMRSRLVMLLPHGIDGQGPDHSSARVERFLLLCDDPIRKRGSGYQSGEEQRLQATNLIVANVTTPANFFHLLCRQALKSSLAHSKPLVVFTPKWLLHQRVCKSPLREMGPNTHFQPVLLDPLDSCEERAAQIRRVVVCTGKIFFELMDAREHAGLESDVALLRLEQLSPFPAEAVRSALGRYPVDSELVWAQEEPENMGAWYFVAPRLRAAAGVSLDPQFVGRTLAASPSRGSSQRTHREEISRLMKSALYSSNRRG